MGFNCRKFASVVLAAIGSFMAASFVNTPNPVFPIAAKGEIGISKTTVGFITSVYDIGVVSTLFFMPQLMKKFNLKTCSCLGLLLSSAAITLFGACILAPSKWLFILLSSCNRFVMSLSNCAVYYSSVPIGTAIYPKHSGKIIGLMETLLCLGRVFGLVQGSFLYSLYGFIAPFAFIGLLGTMLTILMAIVMLPHQKPDDKTINDKVLTTTDEDCLSKPERRKNISVFKFVQKPKVLLVSLPFFLTVTVFGLTAVYLAPLLVEKCHIPEGKTGFYFMTIAIGSATVAPLVGYISDKGGTKIVFSSSILTGFLGCVVIMYILHFEDNHFSAIFLVLVLFGFTGTGSYLSSWLIMRDIVVAEEPEEDPSHIDVLLSAWTTFCFNSGKILGSFFIFGFVFDFFGYFVAIIVQAVCFLIAFIFSLYLIFIVRNVNVKTNVDLVTNAEENKESIS